MTTYGQAAPAWLQLLGGFIELIHFVIRIKCLIEIPLPVVQIRAASKVTSIRRYQPECQDPVKEPIRRLSSLVHVTDLNRICSFGHCSLNFYPAPYLRSGSLTSCFRCRPHLKSAPPSLRLHSDCHQSPVPAPSDNLRPASNHPADVAAG
jgi:hypothetical protein